MKTHEFIFFEKLWGKNNPLWAYPCGIRDKYFVLRLIPDQNILPLSEIFLSTMDTHDGLYKYRYALEKKYLAYLSSRVCCLFLLDGLVSKWCGCFRFLPEAIAAAAATPMGPVIVNQINAGNIIKNWPRIYYMHETLQSNSQVSHRIILLFKQIF